MNTFNDLLHCLRDAPKTLFNPWHEHAPDDADDGAMQRRCDALRHHFDVPTQPALILIGEAPGYRGCRVSGVPFTSERQINGGAIPRIPQYRFSGGAATWSEPSATITWKLLYRLGLAERTVLWNACPWHPPKDGPLTNRAPTGAELLAGRPLLNIVRRLFPDAPIIAVGRVAETQLQVCGIPCLGAARHPAFGGATIFAEQVTALLANRH